jgi:hypothetical protein
MTHHTPSAARSTYNVFAVQITRKDGSKFFAVAAHSCVWTSYHRKNALAYADELAQHVAPRRRIKVVRVQVTVETKVPA